MTIFFPHRLKRTGRNIKKNILHFIHKGVHASYTIRLEPMSLLLYHVFDCPVQEKRSPIALCKGKLLTTSDLKSFAPVIWWIIWRVQHSPALVGPLSCQGLDTLPALLDQLSGLPLIDLTGLVSSGQRDWWQCQYRHVNWRNTRTSIDAIQARQFTQYSHVNWRNTGTPIDAIHAR